LSLNACLPTRNIANEPKAEALNPSHKAWSKPMNDHDKHGTVADVDQDRTEGSAKQMGGKMKEGVGKLFGDAKMKHEGQADQAEGKLQNAWGSAKDEARETFGKDDERDDS
jgi:uncharacterized protein YjbJ (UPF0337 family)